MGKRAEQLFDAKKITLHNETIQSTSVLSVSLFFSPNGARIFPIVNLLISSQISPVT